jgi:predicted aldo/keto reductase-like oxidoreductase
MLSFGIIDFMDKIRKQGRVRHMGFSFHGAKEEFIRIVDGYNWDFAQVQFNILDEHAQAGIGGIEHAHAKGLGIVVMEPLRGGALAGRIPGEAQKIYDSAPVKRSPADWALRWVWNHPEITVVLSGMNDEGNIRENIMIAEDALPNNLADNELAIIEDFRKAYLKSMRVGCTGCAYCMPCPAGINIPSAFLNLNCCYMNSKLEPRMMHALTSCIQTKDGKSHWTNTCLNCGQCEKKCPQGIEIRKAFKMVQKNLEGPVTKAIAHIAKAVMTRKKKG